MNVALAQWGGCHTEDKQKETLIRKVFHHPRSYKLNTEYYIHGSVHRHSILIRSNKMQQMQVFIYCKITLHVSGVYRTHHQEYIKL